MRRTLGLGLVLALAWASCATASRVEDREAELVERWVADHPGQEMTPQDREELRKQAEKEVEDEAAAEREQAIRKGAEVGLSLSRGDILGAIMGAIGLAGLGFSAFRSRKKAA